MNNKYFKLAAFIAIITLMACNSDDSIQKLTEDKVTFEMTPGSDEFTYNYSVKIDIDTVKTPVSVVIYFGDGHQSNNISGSHEYIVLAGSYTAQCYVSAKNAKSEVIKKYKIIVILNDNEKVFADNPSSLLFALTGGKNNITGKVWSIGDKTVVSNPQNRNQIWYDFNGPDPSMLNDFLTFTPNELEMSGKFYLNNNGDTFMSHYLKELFPTGRDAAGSFVTTDYQPSTDATWKITEENGKSYLTIYKGFISYAILPEDLEGTVYEVASYSTSSIILWYKNDPKWQFELVTDEKKINELTGGTEAENGKSWRLRPHNQGSGIIMTRTWTGEVWWTVNASAQGSAAAYDDILTFYADGRAKLENHGDSYLNEATAGLFSDGNPAGSFVTKQYKPSENATWSFARVNGINCLKLNKVFPMYAINIAVMEEGIYEIVEMSDNLLYIKIVAGTGEWDVTWNYYLVSE